MSPSTNLLGCSAFIRSCLIFFFRVHCRFLIGPGPLTAAEISSVPLRFADCTTPEEIRLGDLSSLLSEYRHMAALLKKHRSWLQNQ
jgi:hypothetical protein